MLSPAAKNKQQTLRGPCSYCWGSWSASVSNHRTRSSFTKQGCNPVAVKQVWNAHPWQGSLWGCSVCTVCCKNTPGKGAEHWHQVSPSLQDHWETAANRFDKQAQGDDSSVAPQTYTTPKAVGMSDAMRPPACQLEGKHWWCLQHEWEGKTRGRQMPHHPLFSRSASSCWFQQEAELGPLART